MNSFFYLKQGKEGKKKPKKSDHSFLFFSFTSVCRNFTAASPSFFFRLASRTECERRVSNVDEEPSTDDERRVSNGDEEPSVKQSLPTYKEKSKKERKKERDIYLFIYLFM
jgi:hypothetical protein